MLPPRKVCQCILKLTDTAILVKPTPADMIVLEAKYHTESFTALYNGAKAASNSMSDSGNHDVLHSIAFAELVTYMEDIPTDTNISSSLTSTNVQDTFGIVRC